MALSVDHDVAIVPVPDLEQVGEQAVASQASDEIGLSFLKATAEVPLVEVAQVA